jgi:hypothetical protein
MTNDGEIVNPSRRRFLQGRISPNPTDSSSKFDVELIGTSREFDSDLSTSVIAYNVMNSGTKRISILVRYILGEHIQVIKMLHLGPSESYTGSWTETIPQSRERCLIEVEARCQNAMITRCHNFDGL